MKVGGGTNPKIVLEAMMNMQSKYMSEDFKGRSFQSVLAGCREEMIVSMGNHMKHGIDSAISFLSDESA